ncbi:MAG: tRNA dihydrouridine synthase DusB [Candidatus Neomarinimicrobiota bacterium]
MQIGRLNIKTPVFLAPMAGVSDYPFRILCKEFGAGVVYSEFVSADGIIRENAKTLDMVRFSEFERPIGIQIFGDDPQVMADAARMLVNRFKPDIIDINYGCPVPKVTKKGAGSAALRDLCLMDEITAAVVGAVKKVPVTVKMRSGWDKNSIVALEAGGLLEKLGVKAITLHPRTTKQNYDGQADWSLIRDLKSYINIPVIGNGDIRSAADMQRMLAETGCDGVMIGRAALGNPFIFRELSEAWNNSDLTTTPSLSDRLELCRRHLQMQVDYRGPVAGPNLMRKHFGYYLKGFPGAAGFRHRLVTARDADYMNAILDEIFLLVQT